MKKIFLLLSLVVVAFGMKAAEEEPLFTVETKTSSCSDWGDTVIPEFTVPVEVYDEYVIIRSFYGVEGYDIMVTPITVTSGYSNIAALTNFVNGEEQETITSGNLRVPTGDETTPELNIYISYGSSKYGYVSMNNEDESGYVLLQCYCGEDWTYYYLAWPYTEPVVWKELDLEGATLDYEAVAYSGKYSGWTGATLPPVEEVGVEDYDKYIILRGFAGVEGYDMLVAYNEDEIALSVLSIVNGEWGEQASEVTIPTGLDNYPSITVYPCYETYAASYGLEGGYVIMSAYINNADGTSEWGYYYAEWDEATVSSSVVIPADQVNGESKIFNLKGQRVNDQYKGIVIKDGVKVLNK